MSAVAAEWQSGLRFDAADGRKVKTFLMKGGRLLATDGIDVEGEIVQ